MVVVLDGFNNLQDIVHAVQQSGTVSSFVHVVLYCGIGSSSVSVVIGVVVVVGLFNSATPSRMLSLLSSSLGQFLLLIMLSMLPCSVGWDPLLAVM